jgi:polysaccharide biosynthesis protein PelE
MASVIRVTQKRLTQFGQLAAFAGFAVVVAALSAPITYLALADYDQLWTLLGAHLLIVALCLGWCRFVVPRPQTVEIVDVDIIPDDPHRGQRFWSVFLAISTFALSMPGALAALAGFLFYQLNARNSRPFSEWYAELFPEQSLGLDERIYDELLLTAAQHEDPAKVTPFTDVIAFGTKEEKELAINMMRRYFEAPFAPILKMALDDPNNSVRIQAATAITHLESRFADETVLFENSVEERPTPRAVSDLARHLDRYAFSGLLDLERSLRMRTRALEVYRRYLRAVPDSLQIHVAIGRLLLRSGESVEARACLLAARTQWGSDPRLDAWLMEAHFACKDYAALREIARAALRVKSADSDTPIISEAVRLWAGAASKPVRSNS